MNRLFVVILGLTIAGGAVAQDTFGLWRLVGEEYENFIPVEQFTDPFTLYISLHDASIPAVGGYEVGITTPPEVLILAASGPNGWTNFGDSTNHLVGFGTPLPTDGEPFTILGQLECLGFSEPTGPWTISYHGAEPASIPGHDGPVIADGFDPTNLIACGFVDGSPDVFFFSVVVATEQQSWTAVKSLFD